METDKKKTGYQSRWQDQLRDIAGKIINREPFSYDLNGDALYQQYKDRYIQQGKQAMMDTMGQAATLTGGYGNSYAQSVGQQTYQGYLQGLNDQVPSLYRLALDRYNSEGDRLRGNLNVLMQQEGMDYDRYRDGIADRDDAYSKLMALMTGYDYRPAPEELEEAGMTEAQMKAILGIEDGVGGHGGYDGYFLKSPHDYTPEEIMAIQKKAGIAADGVWGAQTQSAYDRGYRPMDAGYIMDNLPYAQVNKGEEWKKYVDGKVKKAYESGKISKEDVVAITNKLGL